MSLLLSIAAQRRRGSSIDPAITAFATASGATDLTALSNLAAYLRAQSLLTSSRCFPFKSAQNAGSGSTVFGWGDLTANNCTLVNSPTWGASGVSFNGTTQFGRVVDFTSAATLTVFCRANKVDNTTAQTAYFGQYDPGLNKRSVAVWQDGFLTGDPLRMLRSSTGASTGTVLESYEDAKTGIGSDTCFSAQWVDGGGRSLWANKTNLSLSLTVGNTAQTARFDADADWTIAAILNSGSVNLPSQMTATAWLFVQASITDAQRESITDLVNAL